MGVSITTEMCVFLATVITGISNGVIYDLFTIFRRKKRKKLLVSVSDILLSFVICSVIVAVFYLYNSFSLRWYMFIGLFLGVVFYFLCISSIFVFIFEKILQLFHFILKILLTPARFLYKILLVCLFRPVRAFIKFLSEKISGKMNELIINRGIRENERKTKKKHKKKNSKTDNDSTFGSSIILHSKGYNASTTD